MKNTFRITDKNLITEMLNSAEYGVLALSDEKPYAVPVNFVYLNDSIFFHGSPKGKKMKMLETNKNVSFSVISDSIIIPSYFSSTENLACPASAFFKSIIIDGTAEIMDDRNKLAKIFSAIMKNLQPEGKYKSFESNEYDKQFSAVSVIKINIENLSAKFKFGQNLNSERFQMVIEHLEKRGRETDILTIKAMKQFYKK
ncbi:MAG: pyridoxamine 5'-phosphate oxidase family protein [Ignavibacteriae bacterium]|nr:pyridoxamine 5'-phosphate oxidase family protein [Ignavibacteriota bacterium]